MNIKISILNCFFLTSFVFFSCSKTDLQWDLDRSNPSDQNNTISNNSSNSNNNNNPNQPNTDLPTINTLNISSVTSSSFNSGGNITSSGGSSVIQRGICWSNNNSVPTINNSYSTNGTGSGLFTVQISGLIANTTYFVRAYASNSYGTAYGNTLQFTTLQGNSIPSVQTYAISNIGTNTGYGGGNVLNDGGLAVSSKGICWSTNTNPTNSNVNFMTIDGTGTGSFNSYLTNLTHSTTYYVRAYATNSLGTAYGNQVSFTTNFQNSPCNITSSTTHTNGWYFLQNPSNTVYHVGDTYPVTITSPSNYSFSPTNYSYLYLNEQLVITMGYNQFNSQNIAGLLTYSFNFSIPSGLTPSNCYTIRVLRNGDSWVSQPFTILP